MNHVLEDLHTLRVSKLWIFPTLILLCTLWNIFIIITIGAFIIIFEIGRYINRTPIHKHYSTKHKSFIKCMRTLHQKLSKKVLHSLQSSKIYTNYDLLMFYNIRCDIYNNVLNVSSMNDNRYYFYIIYYYIIFKVTFMLAV